MHSPVTKNNVPKSKFLSTVIFNFDNIFFLGIFCHFIEICSSHRVSATKDSLVGHKKGKKNNLFVANKWFLCHTDSVPQTSSKKMAKYCKKVDMVKTKNHVNRKIRLGYIKCVIVIIAVINPPMCWINNIRIFMCKFIVFLLSCIWGLGISLTLCLCKLPSPPLLKRHI